MERLLSSRRLRWSLLVVAVAATGTHASDGEQSAPVGPYVVVLGVTQDGGAPQAGCRKSCCVARRDDPAKRRFVACLGIVDPISNERWMIDATPDFPAQLAMLDELEPPAPTAATPGLSGILLTHAHIGHYTGLMYLGREAIGARATPVYAMGRLSEFLRGNGPWDQLVRLANIELRPLEADKPLQLNERIRVTPLLVPHRDEYSETVGFRIEGPEHAVLYIPDIDKWDRWDRLIEREIVGVDVAYLDGTFYDGDELPGRDMNEIPHPFIVESLERLEVLPEMERAKVRFIHLNHTNRALDDPGVVVVAQRGERVGLF